LYIFSNNLRQKLNLGGSSQLHGEKAWKALHFIMRIRKRGNSNTESLAYMSLERQILEDGAACCDPCREGQIRALDRVQKKALNLARHTDEPNGENLVSRRKQ
jgi:hypothetical protein